MTLPYSEYYDKRSFPGIPFPEPKKRDVHRHGKIPQP